MAITDAEMQSMLCPLCGSRMVLTSKSVAQCPADAVNPFVGETHAGIVLLRGRAKKVAAMASLPAAEKIGVQRMNTRGCERWRVVYNVYGVLYRQAWSFCEDAIFARLRRGDGWVRVRLVRAEAETW